MPKTTTRDFEIFKEECQYWIEYFGIKYEEIDYNHKKVEGAAAEYVGSYRGCCTTITLATNWTGEINDYTVRRTAFHEISEQLFSPLMGLARYAYNNEEVDRATHTGVRTLENTLFNEHYERRFKK